MSIIDGRDPIATPREADVDLVKLDADLSSEELHVRYTFRGSLPVKKFFVSLDLKSGKRQWHMTAYEYRGETKYTWSDGRGGWLRDPITLTFDENRRVMDWVVPSGAFRNRTSLQLRVEVDRYEGKNERFHHLCDRGTSDGCEYRQVGRFMPEILNATVEPEPEPEPEPETP